MFLYCRQTWSRTGFIERCRKYGVFLFTHQSPTFLKWFLAFLRPLNPRPALGSLDRGLGNNDRSRSPIWVRRSDWSSSPGYGCNQL